MKETRTVHEIVPRLIGRDLLVFLEAIEAALDSGNFAELHAARIAGKRLRYDVDFFRAVLGDDADPAYKLLTQLQDRLGFIADATAFDRYYEELIADLDAHDPRRIGLFSLKSENLRERADALVQLRAFWSDGKATAGASLTASIASALRPLAGSSNIPSDASTSETEGGIATPL